MICAKFKKLQRGEWGEEMKEGKRSEGAERERRKMIFLMNYFLSWILSTRVLILFLYI